MVDFVRKLLGSFRQPSQTMLIRPFCALHILGLADVEPAGQNPTNHRRRADRSSENGRKGSKCQASNLKALVANGYERARRRPMPGGATNRIRGAESRWY